MTEPFDQFVADLKRFKPRPPSDTLTRRIERDLANPQPPTPPIVLRSSWLVNSWRPLAAAAALILLAVGLSHLLNLPDDSLPANATGPTPRALDPSQSVGLRRVSQTNYLFGAQEDGLLHLPDAAPLQKLRCVYLETSEWHDEENNATFQVFVPREEVMLVPVNVY